MKLTCVSTQDGVAWVDGTTLKNFNSPSQINTTQQGEAFTYQLVDINMLPDGTYEFVSTASISSVASYQDGLLATCTDGYTKVIRNVIVKGKLLYVILL